MDRLKINWSMSLQEGGIDRQLKRFQCYLQDLGLRPSTIEMHLYRVKMYLQFNGDNQPTSKDFNLFREQLLARKLSRNTTNNYCQAIRHYHQMIDNPVAFHYLKPDDQIPYFFESEDVNRIFDSCDNLKHLAMLQTLFYGCLRASELCNLDDEDLDLKSLTLNVRNGKGGHDGIAFISNNCAETLRYYLKIRPSLTIDNRQPLFYTDYGRGIALSYTRCLNFIKNGQA